MDRPRFGYLRVLVVLKREGLVVGKKRVYRLYRLEGADRRLDGGCPLRGKLDVKLDPAPDSYESEH